MAGPSTLQFSDTRAEIRTAPHRVVTHLEFAVVVEGGSAIARRLVGGQGSHGFHTEGGSSPGVCVSHTLAGVSSAGVCVSNTLVGVSSTGVCVSETLVGDQGAATSNLQLSLRAASPLPDAWLWVSGFGFRVSGTGFQVQGFGFRLSGFGFGISGFGFRVSSFGFRVSGLVEAPCRCSGW